MYPFRHNKTNVCLDNIPQDWINDDDDVNLLKNL